MYGPARTGSVPIVVGRIGGARHPGDGFTHVASTGGSGDNGGDDDGTSGSSSGGNGGERLYPDERFVTWDSEARIYYRTSIEEKEWVGAYYVAPISSTVLSKVLDFAVRYGERHRRYQSL